MCRRCASCATRCMTGPHAHLDVSAAFVGNVGLVLCPTLFLDCSTNRWLLCGSASLAVARAVALHTLPQASRTWLSPQHTPPPPLHSPAPLHCSSVLQTALQFTPLVRLAPTAATAWLARGPSLSYAPCAQCQQPSPANTTVHNAHPPMNMLCCIYVPMRIGTTLYHLRCERHGWAYTWMLLLAATKACFDFELPS